MKIIESMLVVACLSLSLPLAAQSLAKVEAIPHMSGGVGEEQRSAMQDQRKDFTLGLTFAVKGSGEYMADVSVRVEDAHGVAVFDMAAAGPLLYLKLPAGIYRVSASANRQSFTQFVKLAQGEWRELYFYWHAQ
jgi:hypothetical protein